MPEPRQGPRVGWASMWPLAPTCIMAPMTSVTFLGINLNGGKTCVWKHKREGGRCVPSSHSRAESTLNVFREGTRGAWTSLLCERGLGRGWGPGQLGRSLSAPLQDLSPPGA